MPDIPDEVTIDPTNYPDIRINELLQRDYVKRLWKAVERCRYDADLIEVVDALESILGRDASRYADELRRIGPQPRGEDDA